MGGAFMDYMVTDQNLIPPKTQKFFSEKPIYMPYCANTLDNSIPISEKIPSRTELGLPEEGFVFCAINNSYKITPKEFDIWMSLLKQVKGSVLWLLDRNKWAKENLLNEAKVRGVKKERLVFQSPMVTDTESQSKYLVQFKQADLYLDTFIYGAGSTANNALYTGLPVLTKIGRSLPARMAATYLSALGLPELITKTDKDYKNMALELSQNSEKLSLLKKRLADTLKTSPLCNTELFTRHLEDGYIRAYKEYFIGNNPNPILIPK
jgi:predicted O-linked N-acetylglucosamine transferase (SPINDLY family)